MAIQTYEKQVPPSILTFKRFWLALAVPAVDYYISLGGYGFARTLSHDFFQWAPISAMIFGSALPKYLRNHRRYTATSYPGRQATSIWTIKRLWLALTVPTLIWLANSKGSGLSTVVYSLILWLPVSALIVLSALPKFIHRCNLLATVNNFNENGDGIYCHELKANKCKLGEVTANSAMTLDTNKRLITLESGKNKKTYSFDDIRRWRYNLSSGGEAIGSDVGTVVQAALMNQSSRQKNYKESGLFISVKDIDFPEWQIMFYPTEGRYHTQIGILNMELQLKRWMEVFSQVINQE